MKGILAFTAICGWGVALCAIYVSQETNEQRLKIVVNDITSLNNSIVKKRFILPVKNLDKFIVLKNSGKIYSAAGKATVKLSSGCFGVLVRYSDKIALVTAAHCVKQKSVKYKYSYFWNEEKFVVQGYSGYGYLNRSSWDGKIEVDKMFIDKEKDIAVTFQIKTNDTSDLFERSLPLSKDKVDDYSLVYGLHWQNQCWNSGKSSCSAGELLIPTMGFSSLNKDDSGKDNGNSSHFIVCYPGDSGAPLIDTGGNLIGIYRASPTKKVESISMTAVNVKAIGQALDQAYQNNIKTGGKK